jgi:aspartokinase/homoserine dehydrogenase 1
MISVLHFERTSPQAPHDVAAIAAIIEQAHNSSPNSTTELLPTAPQNHRIVVVLANSTATEERPNVSQLKSLLNAKGLSTEIVSTPESDVNTAAFLAARLKAEALEVWTPHDGFSTCDPSIVPSAKILPEISYSEAMEFAFFGSQAIPPTALLPVIEAQIPTVIRNILKPHQPGTRIHAHAKSSNGVIRAVTSLPDIAMFNIAGTGMKGVAGMASRTFLALSRKSISIIFITQASSEYSIGLCVAKCDAQRAHEAICAEFKHEIQNGSIELPETLADVAILSLVGDKMREKRGVAATFFGALASIDVNIIAIAQGPSERNISVVIAGRDRVRALKKCHEFFFSTTQQIQLFLVGVGGVGEKLLNQIQMQSEKLRKQNIEINVCGIGSTKGLLLSESGIDLHANWKSTLPLAQPFSLETIVQHVENHRPTNPVFVDCTSDTAIASRYPDLFRAGLHVATPNKKANTQSMEYYRELRVVADERKRRFLYETNVGAGLPVIDSLKNLIKSGDTLVEFQGILSGSLSFLFGLLEDGVSFSTALNKARELGFTEPDPRDDLCGIDVARKLLILARETGRNLELSDIAVESVLPKNIPAPESLADFLSHTTEYDNFFRTLIAAAQTENCVLRYVGEINAEGCRVGIKRVPRNHPLAAIRGGENALSFLSHRYQPTPLVIRGYGAGAEVTAAGVFADILKTVFWNLDVI